MKYVCSVNTAYIEMTVDAGEIDWNNGSVKRDKSQNKTCVQWNREGASAGKYGGASGDRATG